MLALVLHQARFDLRGFARNRQARFSTLLMPLILLAALLSAFGDDIVGPDHTRAATYYVPGICTLAVLAACFANVATAVTAQRETGVLKRRRATPAPAVALIAGRALTAIAAALATIAAAFLLGRVAYGVALPAADIPSVALTAVAGAASFCCLGYALSTAIRSLDAAQPIVQAILLPLYFTSGVFIPSVSLPAWLQDAARALPVEPLSHAFHRAFAGAAAPAWGDLAVLLAWGIAGLGIALARFRWTPTPATDR
jgi:ABC-2 type transport system permease protein